MIKCILTALVTVVLGIGLVIWFNRYRKQIELDKKDQVPEPEVTIVEETPPANDTDLGTG